MAEYTPNLNLLKKDPATEGNDTFNIKTMLNDNWDKIDEKVATKEDLDQIEVPVTSVNGKIGDVELTASDVGAETPEGAQEKADAALAGANTYTDQEVGEVAQTLNEHLDDNASTSKKGHVQLTDSVSSTSITTAATPNSVKQAYDKANAALPKSGGTMTGILTAQSNTSYTVRQVRNIILSNADANIGAMLDGDIWIKYK